MLRSLEIITPRLDDLVMHICDSHCPPSKRGRSRQLKDVSQAASNLMHGNGGTTLRHLHLHTLDTGSKGDVLDLPNCAPALASLILPTFHVRWLDCLPPNLTSLTIVNGIDDVGVFISRMKCSKWPAGVKELQVKGLKKEERAALRRACTDIGCKLK